MVVILVVLVCLEEDFELKSDNVIFSFESGTIDVTVDVVELHPGIPIPPPVQSERQ